MNTNDAAARVLYEQCVREHSATLYRLAYRLCRRTDLAEDLTQETCCAARKTLSSLSDPAKSKAWLFQILRFRWSHYLRAQSRRIRTTTSHDLAAKTAQPNPIDRLADADLLSSALNRIDPTLKMPLLLVVAEGYTCCETAGVLQIPLGTVLSRIYRAKSVLRKHLEKCPSIVLP